MAFLPLKPIPIKDRNSMIFIGMGRIDVRDGAFAVIDEVNGERMLIPVGSVVCIMLEYGYTGEPCRGQAGGDHRHFAYLGGRSGRQALLCWAARWCTLR